MNISSKLQIKSVHKVYVENPPAGFLVDLPEGAQLVDREDAADAVALHGGAPDALADGEAEAGVGA